MSLDPMTRPNLDGFAPTAGGGRSIGRGATAGRWFRKLVVGAVFIVMPACVGKFADDQLGASWGTIPYFVNIAGLLAFAFAGCVAFFAIRGAERLRDRIGDRPAHALLAVVVIAAVVLSILRTAA